MIKDNKQVESVMDYVHKIFRNQELEYIEKDGELTVAQREEKSKILEYLERNKR